MSNEGNIHQVPNVLNIATLIGYGRSNSHTLRFSGEANDFNRFLTRFKSCLATRKLNKVLDTNHADANDAAKKEQVYHALVSCLDDESLDLVSSKAENNGPEAIKLLKERFLGKNEDMEVQLLKQLLRIKLQIGDNPLQLFTKIDQIKSKLETLNNGYKQITDKIYTVVALDALNDPKYDSFRQAVNVRKEWPEWKEFQSLLKVQGDALEVATSEKEVILRHQDGKQVQHFNRFTSQYSKGNKGQFNKPNLYCDFCKKKGHTYNKCYKKKAQEKKVRAAALTTGNSGHGVQNYFTQQKSNLDPPGNVTQKSNYNFMCNAVYGTFDTLHATHNDILVDSGATSHIVCDSERFTYFDKSYDPTNHYVELADGTRTNGLIKGKGNAKFQIYDSQGNVVSITVNDALFIPSYDINIFSVKKAAIKGAQCLFSSDGGELTSIKGVKFPIISKHNLYWFNTICTDTNEIITVLNDNENMTDNSVITISDGKYSSEMWHRILGHCNWNDIYKLEKVVDGMKLSNKSDETCETCIKGKMVQPVSTKADKRATTPFEFVHTDLCGPISPPSKEGYRFVINFVDDYSGLTKIYFLKRKSETVQATKRFIADISPLCAEKNYSIKRLRSDQGTEYTSAEFQQLLTDNCIRHEFSAPYSPHQNGTAERSWRTLFDMTRCLIIESNLQKGWWPHAIATAAYIRNRCYITRLQITPYEAVTGVKPNLKNMHIFGTMCYAYVQKKDRGKLDPRGEEGIFLGYDTYSPSYVVYLPRTNTVKNVRVVKFTDKFKRKYSAESVCQTPQFGIQMPTFQDFIPLNTNTPAVIQPAQEAQPSLNSPLYAENPVIISPPIDNGNTQQNIERRYPVRERQKPPKFNDFVSVTVDCCYRVSAIPRSYKQAMSSQEAPQWKQAMDKEMASLKENNSYEEVPLPAGANLIGSRWVYAVKLELDGQEHHKARFVAKGFSQIAEEDYLDTFAPTARKTTVRMVIQEAVNQDMVTHQMDFNTAFLNADLDVDIFIKPPDGYTTNQNVWKLNKGLYGLKQSSRLWNTLLDKFLCNNKFTRSMTDNCLYTYFENGKSILIVVWVDDLIICASNIGLMNSIKQKLNDNFKMKDLGQISYFLGIEFDLSKDCIKMHQTRYAKTILEKFNMIDCNSKKTPCPLGINKELGNNSPLLGESTLYREIIGSLMYLMTNTRPDICYIVSFLSQFMVNPTFAHLQLAKHVLKYIKGTLNKGLTFVKSSDGSAIKGYCDSDWGGSIDRHSISGYGYMLNDKGPLISWRCSKQRIIALSSCEAEYVALTAAIQEAKFLRQLLADIQGSRTCIVKLYADNQGAIALAKNPVHHQRTKHIDIKYHFIRFAIEEGIVDLQYIPTGENIADQFTKPLSWVKLSDFSMISGPMV